MIFGPGMCNYVGGEWCPQGVGGRLFLVDGLFDISYGPHDVVLLDGNIPHGITNLSDLPGEGHLSHVEHERFSGILFPDFQRRGMMKHGNYVGMWKEEWMSGIVRK